MKLKNPHDKFFKETFGDPVIAGDFLTNYLPASLLTYIDIETLETQKDSFIDEKLEETFSDLLFKASIAGETGYIYFLFEHKSYPDKGIAFQVLRYMVDIWESKMDKEFGRLPVILPLIVYHGKLDWRIPSSLGSIINNYNELPAEIKTHVPDFNYLLYDISGYTDKEVKGAVQTRIGLTLLRDIFTLDNEKILQSFYRSVNYLNELEDRQRGIEYFETMMRYIASAAKSLTKKDVEELLNEVEANYQEGSEIAMTLADMWREEGMEKGMEKGERTGLIEMVIQGLFMKFKKVPHDIRAEIQELDTPVLKAILLKIMSDDSFKSLDEVREYL